MLCKILRKPAINNTIELTIQQSELSEFIQIINDNKIDEAAQLLLLCQELSDALKLKIDFHQRSCIIKIKDIKDKNIALLVYSTFQLSTNERQLIIPWKSIPKMIQSITRLNAACQEYQHDIFAKKQLLAAAASKHLEGASMVSYLPEKAQFQFSVASLNEFQQQQLIDYSQQPYSNGITLNIPFEDFNAALTNIGYTYPAGLTELKTLIDSNSQLAVDNVRTLDFEVDFKNEHCYISLKSKIDAEINQLFINHYGKYYARGAASIPFKDLINASKTLENFIKAKTEIQQQRLQQAQALALAITEQLKINASALYDPENACIHLELYTLESDKIQLLQKYLSELNISLAHDKLTLTFCIDDLQLYWNIVVSKELTNLFELATIASALDYTIDFAAKRVHLPAPQNSFVQKLLIAHLDKYMLNEEINIPFNHLGEAFIQLRLFIAERDTYITHQINKLNEALAECLQCEVSASYDIKADSYKVYLEHITPNQKSLLALYGIAFDADSMPIKLSMPAADFANIIHHMESDISKDIIVWRNIVNCCNQNHHTNLEIVIDIDASTCLLKTDRFPNTLLPTLFTGFNTDNGIVIPFEKLSKAQEQLKNYMAILDIFREIKGVIKYELAPIPNQPVFFNIEVDKNYLNTTRPYISSLRVIFLSCKTKLLQGKGNICNRKEIIKQFNVQLNNTAALVGDFNNEQDRKLAEQLKSYHDRLEQIINSIETEAYPLQSAIKIGYF